MRVVLGGRFFGFLLMVLSGRVKLGRSSRQSETGHAPAVKDMSGDVTSSVMDLLKVLESIRSDGMLNEEYHKSVRGFHTLMPDGRVFVTKLRDKNQTDLISDLSETRVTKLVKLLKSVAASSDFGVRNISQIAKIVKKPNRSNRPKRNFYYYRSYTPLPERTAVGRYEMKGYPYYNIVRLSTGCTGSLISHLYVLTAAHCVHDGDDFREKLEMMKVEVPDSVTEKLYYIHKISVPTGWYRSKYINELERSSYDYAIIRLSKPVRSRHKFMKLSIIQTQALYDRTLHYLGYSEEGDVDLWKASCVASSNIIFMAGQLMLSQCGSEAGNSGAAVYTKGFRTGENIIGILSNTVSARVSRQFTFSRRRYSTITTFTWQKIRDMCNMMEPESASLEICDEVEAISLLMRNRVDSFWG